MITNKTREYNKNIEALTEVYNNLVDFMSEHQDKFTNYQLIDMRDELEKFSTSIKNIDGWGLDDEGDPCPTYPNLQRILF